MTDSRACQRVEIDRCRTTRWSGPSLGAPRIRELIGWAAQLQSVRHPCSSTTVGVTVTIQSSPMA